MGNANIENRVKEVLSIALDLDPSKINQETSIINTPEWESLKHINLILSIEQEFVVHFNDAEIGDLISFAAICETLRKKLVEKA